MYIYINIYIYTYIYIYIYMYIYKDIYDSVKRRNKLVTLNNQQVLRIRLLHVPANCDLLPVHFGLASQV